MICADRRQRYLYSYFLSFDYSFSIRENNKYQRDPNTFYTCKSLWVLFYNLFMQESRKSEFFQSGDTKGVKVASIHLFSLIIMQSILLHICT